MARYEPSDLTGALAPVNAELEKIKEAFKDTFSRKGDSPNAMEASLDMNSNRVLNLLNAENDKEPATFGQLKALEAALKKLIEQIVGGTLPDETELTPEQIEEIIDGVTQDVLSSDLVNDLNQQILGLGSDVQGLDQSLRALIQETQDTLNQSIANLGIDVDALSDELQADVDLLTQNLNSEIIRINNIFGDLEDIDTAIVNETTARTNADEAIVTSVSGLASQYNTLNAQLLVEAQTRATADSALAQTITSLQTFSAKIFVQPTAPSIAVAPDNAVEGDLWYDSDDGNHPYTLIDVSGTLTWTSIRDQIFQALQSQIQTEQTARIDGDTALASEVVTLTALVNTNNSNTLAAIQNESTVRASEDDALATQISTLTSSVDSDIATVTSQVQSEATARATADTALASDISSLTAVVNTNASTAAAQISSEATVRATADTALASQITSLTSTVNGNTAAIQTEQTTRASADSALASQVNTVAATRNRVFYQASAPSASSTGDLWFDSDDGNKPYRWSGSAWINITDNRTVANAAAITSEQTARISADQALASDISTVVASVNSNTAAIQSEATARSTADTSLANQINSLSASVGSNAAAILQEQTARANGDSALSSSISTLATSVNGNTAAIQTTQTVTDGLKAQYTVKVDNNGYVSGFGLASTPVNGTPFSEFVVLADRFSIVTPGVSPTVPFAVDASGVYIQTAFIRELNASKITGQIVNNQIADLTINGVKLANGAVTADKIFAGSVTADKIQAGAITATKLSADAIDGKVIKGATFITTEVGEDSVEVKSGTPFGVSGNLFEWYGLKVNGVTWNNSTNEPITSGMSTVNSKFHKTVDGRIYFGGSFQAGTLSNSTTNTQLATTSIADLGSFGSNGGQILVTGSFSYAASTFSSGTCPTGTATTGTLFLERLVSGSWNIVAQVPITGTYNCSQEGPEYIAEWNSGSSVTFTDNNQNTTPRQYRARAVVNALPGTQRNKSLTCVSTEE